ncbi:hypothetical protein GC170_07345 [bacterium]|nr:hypothetical protein [bacterium]
MRRNARKFVVAGLVLVGVLLTLTFGVLRMASSPPDYYSEIIAAEAETDEELRHEQAKELVGDVVQMRNDIANDPEWTIRLTDKAVNAWLAENSLTELIEDFPAQLSQPRIQFAAERLNLAFRWDGPPAAAVISMSLRPECAEPNELRIGVDNLRVGMLPLYGQRFQQDLVDALKNAGIDARWEVKDDLPTLCLKITPTLQSRSVELQRITVLDGEIRMNGRSQAEVNVERLGKEIRESGGIRRVR